ncbi:MAG TPA: hypothetical protein VMB20_08500 [Candidatus Acidoferrum sp.]|nr:hypothetical protein [Candidatus Acidoferrum sp.]
MHTSVKRALRFSALAAALALLITPSLGLAQQPAAVPSYATRRGETIKGTISGFNGATTMYVRDVRGYVDDVTLHQGTIINPTGIRLQPGYPVTIYGRPSGSTFLADQIDTPFRTLYAYPYAYPAYYGYPAVGLGFGWGWGGWGWRGWR